MALWYFSMVSVKSIEIEFQSHHILYVLVAVGLIIGFTGMYQELVFTPASGLTIMDWIGADDLFGDAEEWFIGGFNEFSQNEIFQQLGVVITFGYSMTPSVKTSPGPLSP